MRTKILPLPSTDLAANLSLLLELDVFRHVLDCPLRWRRGTGQGSLVGSCRGAELGFCWALFYLCATPATLDLLVGTVTAAKSTCLLKGTTTCARELVPIKYWFSQST